MKRTRAQPAARRRTRSIRIDIADHQRLLRLPHARIRTVVRHTLRAESVDKGEIEIALVNDATIRKVHREFFGDDTPTDVITFPLNEPPAPLAGAIVVSVETATRVAPRHRASPEREVLLYVIHGTLHLCGYNDRRPRDARRMRRRQSELLDQVASG
jgi:probable rRNA maturation factor